jgi:hypothetical protein
VRLDDSCKEKLPFLLPLLLQDTFVAPFMTRETVAVETAVDLATSLIVM